MQQPPDNHGQRPFIGGQDRGGPHQQHRPQVELTPEEKRVFQECNRESYFTRSLPASVILGGLAFMGVRRGILRPHARFGAMPKMVGAAIIGYFFGKVSYLQVCREKFLTQLPNSNISISIRRARGEEIYYEEPPKSPEYAGNVNSDPSMGSAEASDSAKKRFSYDDLRDQHRRQRFQSAGQSPPPPPQTSGAIMSPVGQVPPSLMPPDEGWSSEPSFASRSTVKKANKYGDEGFE